MIKEIASQLGNICQVHSISNLYHGQWEIMHLNGTKTNMMQLRDGQLQLCLTI